MYTLIGTATLNGMDPEARLRHTLERIADHPIQRIAELPPWNVRLDETPEPSQLIPAHRRPLLPSVGTCAFRTGVHLWQDGLGRTLTDILTPLLSNQCPRKPWGAGFLFFTEDIAHSDEG